MGVRALAGLSGIFASDGYSEVISQYNIPRNQAVEELGAIPCYTLLSSSKEGHLSLDV